MTRTLSGLSSAQKTLQLLFPGFRFGSDDPAEAERLVDMGVGGFCLYGGRVHEIAEFTRRLQERARLPLLFCADYEDGTASHVAGGTALPSNMAVGASGSEAFAYQKALITALEARALGVRWVLAPVLDLATRPENPIVNVRSFGADPEGVSRMGRAYIRGLAAGRVLSCAKHFPGHGDSRGDSHLGLPLLRLTRARLSGRELMPFRATRDVADSVMMAHLSIPSLGGAGKPTSLSRGAVSLLRRELGYDGLVSTDALSMRAIGGRYPQEEACLAALDAGNDVLLVPADPLAAARALPGRVEGERRLHDRVEAAFRRLGRAKEACGLFADRGLSREDGPETVGKARHGKIARALAEAGLAWVGGPVAPPRKLLYLEPDAAGPEDWQGRAFVGELRALGLEVAPYAGPSTEPVLVAAFLTPRAYTGRIAFSPRELRAARRALSKSSNGLLVSFGSPFVFDALKGWTGGLCAFSPIEASQKAAAAAFSGRVEARGALPVPLKALSTAGGRRRAGGRKPRPSRAGRR